MGIYLAENILGQCSSSIVCEVAKSWDGIREVARSQIPDGILGHGKSLGFHSKRDGMSEGLRREMMLSVICLTRTPLVSMWE